MTLWLNTLMPNDQPAGYGYTWWRDDPLPALPPLDGFQAGPAADLSLLAALAGLEPGEARRRVESGSQPYQASLHGSPAAWGWCAAREYRFYGHFVPLQPGERALWDFATLPERRGLGVYPRLLQAILLAEQDARRFWIGHAAGNRSSQQGILKAGFQLCTASLLESGLPRILALGSPARAAASPMGRAFGCQ